MEEQAGELLETLAFEAKYVAQELSRRKKLGSLREEMKKTLERGRSETVPKLRKLVKGNSRLESEFQGVYKAFVSAEDALAATPQSDDDDEEASRDGQDENVQEPLYEATDNDYGTFQLDGSKQSQAQVQDDGALAKDVAFQTLIQQERGEQISRIHQSVQEVNAIFKELGSLVTQQQQPIDTIDNNINHFRDDVARASRQLNRAQHQQQRRTRCGTATLIIMIVIILIVLAAMS